MKTLHVINGEVVFEGLDDVAPKRWSMAAILRDLVEWGPHVVNVLYDSGDVQLSNGEHHLAGECLFKSVEYGLTANGKSKVRMVVDSTGPVRLHGDGIPDPFNWSGSIEIIPAPQ